MNPKDAPTPATPPRRQRGRPREDKGEAATVRSLDRAMHLLSTLAGMQGATLSGLAQAAGESPATVYRVLTTLEAHRMTEFDEAAQTWHVGAGAFLVGATFLRRTSLVERARPVLRALMEATGETANLGVEVSSGAGGAVLFVSQVETHAPIRAFFPPGTTSPLHASGIGKVLLAHMPPARAARLLGGALAGYTPRTITDPGALASALAEVRARPRGGRRGAQRGDALPRRPRARRARRNGGGHLRVRPRQPHRAGAPARDRGARDGRRDGAVIGAGAPLGGL